MTDVKHDFQRVVPMEGGHNFRDIGGYPARDGRRVATGIAAALLLDLLGVPRERVIDDYALTDQFFSRGCELVAKDPIGGRFAGVDPKVWEPMMRAGPAYLEIMFDTIETRHGSGEGFLRDELGLDDAVLSRIYERLLV